MNLKLAEFISKSFETGWLAQFPVVWCVSDGDYPCIFFSFLFSRLREKGVLQQISNICLQECDAPAVQAMVSASFLGMRVLYVLGDSGVLAPKQRASLCSFLATYQGPHCCVLFVSRRQLPTQLSGHLVVDVDENVDRKLFEAICQYTHGSCAVRDRRFALQLYAKKRVISIDTACLLARYARLCTYDYEIFSSQVLDHLVIPEHSLFVLAQYFFAGERDAFFNEWRTISDSYPEVFWTSYWSDQIWRAHHYVRLLNEKRADEAKFFAKKLPFSFINYGWKRVQLHALQDALLSLYEIDVRFKSGVSIVGAFELLFLRFFSQHENVVGCQRARSQRTPGLFA